MFIQLTKQAIWIYYSSMDWINLDKIAQAILCIVYNSDYLEDEHLIETNSMKLNASVFFREWIIKRNPLKHPQLLRVSHWWHRFGINKQAKMSFFKTNLFKLINYSISIFLNHKSHDRYRSLTFTGLYSIYPHWKVIWTNKNVNTWS